MAQSIGERVEVLLPDGTAVTGHVVAVTHLGIEIEFDAPPALGGRTRAQFPLAA